MKKKVLSSCLALTLTLSMLATPVSATSVSAVSLVTDPPGRTGEDVYQSIEDTVLSKEGTKDGSYQAVYLGVKGYGTVTKDEKEDFVHQFSVDGKVQEYTIATGEEENYAIQNILAEGYVFDITVADGVVTGAEPAEVQTQGPITSMEENSITVDSQEITLEEDTAVYTIEAQAGGAQVTAESPEELAEGDTVKVYEDNGKTVVYETFVAEEYEPPVSYTPGERTLKNFLAAAMQPVGTALYVYGGSWDWQDVGSSRQSTTIGVPQTWKDFFQSQDENYTYRNNDDHAHSYYPHEAWNQYYFAGVDCSAYVAWSVYNTLNTQSGKDGYVMSSTGMAKNFAQDRGFGTWTQEFAGPEDFHTGDVFSMNGHVWICLGVCEDGSLVILHSTPSDSRSGAPGGGVQISGVGESEDCQAVALAREYMSKYFPAWSERYEAAFKAYDDYTSFSGSSAGKFTWNLAGDGVLSDPDSYADMTADEILADLFGEGEEPVAEEQQAVYLGVKGYGTVTKDEKEDFVHQFSVDGKVQEYTIATGEEENYAIQNILAEGYVFDITVADGVVTGAEPAEVQTQGPITSMEENSITVDSQEITLEEDTAVYTIEAQAGGAQVTAESPEELAEGDTVKVYEDNGKTVVYETFVAEEYEPPVSYTPGERTLKNFLAAAMQPVGTALYVYGGSWDWQDVGSSRQSTTIGVPQTWKDFFQSQDENYTYRNNDDHAHSYYPHEAWNQYYFAGVDCSAYVAWSVYNTLNTQSGKDGYVMSSTGMAKNFAQDRGFGTWTQEFAGPEDFHTGDVFSMNGHVWICLGVCEDGSLVILHSTPSDSRSGAPGGGVQISGVGESEDCQAVALAREYMSKYFPAWSERYEAAFKAYDDYTSFSGSSAGKFTWNLAGDGVLSDPDGYANMTADEILADLFGENEDRPSGGGGGGNSSSSGVSVSSGSHGRVRVSPDSPKTGDKVVLTPVPDEGYQLDSLTVLDRRGNEIALTERADGTYTYTQPAGRVTVKAQFEKIEDPEPSVTEFQDVQQGVWYYDAVGYVAQHGLMNGTATGRFSPNASTTRGMIVTILYSMAGKPDTGSALFQDVAPDAWYAEAVAWAANNGIVSGYSDASFGPDDPITREQLVAILYRYAQHMQYDVSARSNLSRFNDANQLATYATDSMSWALAEGLITGMSSDVLAPQDGAVRAQVAVILMSFCQNIENNL